MSQNVSFLPELNGFCNIFQNMQKSEMQFLTNRKMFQCLPTACLLMGSPHIQETKTQVSISLKTYYPNIHSTMYENSPWTFMSFESYTTIYYKIHHLCFSNLT